MERFSHFGRVELENPFAEALRRAEIREEQAEPEDEERITKCVDCGCTLSETEVDELGDTCEKCYNEYIEATEPNHPDRRGR